MTETSKLIPIRLFAVLALAAAACSVEAGNQIPCVEDLSCPNDYPVCVSGKCTAGTSTAKASVAVVGAEGHATTDFLSGTVRVIVSARASSGVKTVSLAFGTASFTAATPAATPPLYAFDVDTATLTDGDRDLTATLTAGDGTVATASGTLHVDNAKPVITSFTVAGATSTTITAGNSVAISASFTGGTTASITDGSGSVGIATGGSVLVSPDTLTTYSLVVTSRSGISVQSGTTGQPPNVFVAVAQRASTTAGNFSVNRTLIDHNDNGTLSFTAPTFSGAFTALVKDPGGQSVGAIASSGTLSNVLVASMTASTTQLTYTLVISNGATIPDTLSIPVVVTVRPHISAFTFGASGPTTTIDPGETVSLNYNFSGGTTANINGVNAPLPGPVAFSNLQASAVYTLTVTNAAGISSTQTATATVRAKIYSFTVGATQAASANQAIITAGTTTNLFAAFAGSATPNADLACATACSITLPTPAKIVNGGSAVVTPNATGTFNYTLTVTPSAGASPVTSGPVTVKVVPSATITSFAAARSIVHSGGSTTLTATFDAGLSSAAPGSATIVGLDDLGGTTTYSGVTSGVDVNVAPLASTTYSLHVINGAGTPAVSTPSVRVNVAKGTWSALNNTAIDVRRGATVTALDSGKVLITGGLNSSGAPIAAAYLCDATGACTSKTMGTARAFHTATKVTFGTNIHKVLIAAGTGPSGALKSAEFFDGDPTAESFSNTTDIGPAASARSHHIAVLLGDGSTILIAGGNDGSADVKTAITYDTNSTPNPTATAMTNQMTQTRADFTGTLLDVAPTATSKVLIVGGHATIATAELFDPSGPNTFTATTNPLGEDKRSHTAVLIAGTGPNIGKVLISGGVTGSGPGSASSTQYLYDATAQSFAQTAPLATSRSGHAGIFVPTDSVLLCGGTTDGTDPLATLASCERYNASAETQGPTAPMLQPRRDFGLVPMTVSSILEYLAAGGMESTPSPGTAFAETYNPN
jgi:hypothetical protein